MRVLDTSAIIRSGLDFSDGGYVITDGVLSELLDDDLRDLIALSIGNKHIKVRVPSETDLKIIEEAARETGDLGVLSKTDLGVLAVACENKAVIVSDDYAIQNVASALRISFERVSQDGIKKKVSWRRVCIGCGRKYPPDYKGACSVCGQKTVRRPEDAASF
jgi:UPF0271 protein